VYVDQKTTKECYTTNLRMEPMQPSWDNLPYQD